MKTSLIIIVLIFLNTSVIISETIAKLINDINIWWFISLELALVLGYYINKTVKDLRSYCQIDCNNLKLVIVKGK
jgi:hypothetical protein